MTYHKKMHQQSGGAVAFAAGSAASGKTDSVCPIERAVAPPSVTADEFAFVTTYGARVFLPREWRGWVARSGPYGFMQEIEARDAHLAGCLRTRRSALAAAELRVIDTDDTLRAQTVGAFVRSALNDVTGIRDALNQLLDAFGKGWALVEVMWRRDPDGRVRIESLQPRRQERFAIDTQNRLWLIDMPGNGALSTIENIEHNEPELCPHPTQTRLYAENPQLMPQRKFCRFVHEPGASSPYGSPLSARVSWLVCHKLHGIDQWYEHNTHFMTPMPVAKPPKGMSKIDEENLRYLMQNRHQQAGLILPKNVDYELVEPKGNGTVTQSYREMLQWCNDEISRVVLGQTLTSGEGTRSGSRALGSVHERVLAVYHEADALSFGEQLTAQLARWLTDFNFGTDEPAPRIVFETRDAEGDLSEIELDEKLLRMGVPLSTAWFYRRYRRPVPAGAENPLRYDDQNLFQYHLHYGILTINEARERLGLPRVPWGDRVVSDPGATASNAGVSGTGVSSEEKSGSLENAGETEIEPSDAREVN